MEKTTERKNLEERYSKAFVDMDKGEAWGYTTSPPTAYLDTRTDDEKREDHLKAVVAENMFSSTKRKRGTPAKRSAKGKAEGK